MIEKNIISENIFTYDKKKYNFVEKLSDILGCELDMFHKMFDIHHTNTWVGGESPATKEGDIIHFIDKIYKYFREDYDFQVLWKVFCEEVIKKIYFKDKSIVIQRLPSIKIVPAKSKLYYSETIYQNNIEYNAHTDGGPPWHHPVWDTNFWMPLTNTNEENTIYIEENFRMTPRVMKKGEILAFDGNHLLHGSRVYNDSENSRVSFDFRGLLLEDYDIKKLSDKIITSRGLRLKQFEYYNAENYYMIVE